MSWVCTVLLFICKPYRFIKVDHIVSVQKCKWMNKWCIRCRDWVIHPLFKRLCNVWIKCGYKSLGVVIFWAHIHEASAIWSISTLQYIFMSSSYFNVLYKIWNSQFFQSFLHLFFSSRTEKLLIYLEIFQALSFLMEMLLSNIFLLKCFKQSIISLEINTTFQHVLCVHTYMLFMNYIDISIGICQAYFTFWTLLFICCT